MYALLIILILALVGFYGFRIYKTAARKVNAEHVANACTLVKKELLPDYSLEFFNIYTKRLYHDLDRTDPMRCAFVLESTITEDSIAREFTKTTFDKHIVIMAAAFLGELIIEHSNATWVKEENEFPYLQFPDKMNAQPFQIIYDIIYGDKEGGIQELVETCVYAHKISIPATLPFKRLLDDSKIAEYAADLNHLSTPAFRMILHESSEEELTPLESRLGGRPALPASVYWPLYEYTAMSFVGQINLTEVPKGDADTGLPLTGHLFFFYNAKQDTNGLHPDHKASWKVLYFDLLPQTIEMREPPVTLPDYARFATSSIEWKAVNSYPSWTTEEVGALNMSPYEQDTYEDMLEEDTFSFYKGKNHQLLGHARPLQEDMRLQCQLAFNGVDCTGEGEVKDEPFLKQGVNDWILLLQVDTDLCADMIWGEHGRLYYYIRKQDLAKKNFNDVWMILQTEG